MRMKLVSLLSGIALLCLGACSPTKELVEVPYQELYRPQFHFTPAINWTNDPNGLVYYDGEYHLFYQYNPFRSTWGHMSWGHAVSKDLLHWEHLPIALHEYLDPRTDDSTMVFSGTVVIDKNNTSGLCSGKECMVAIYTSHVHSKGQTVVQHQSLAHSNDKGRTWTRYDKNPVLDMELKDFRDPKVFWFEPEQKWVMAVVVPDQYVVRFYESKNLLSWTQTGEFGKKGDIRKIWECPDLYEVPVEDKPNQKKWVLSLSCSHPQGQSFVGMQYFVGSFDGKTFQPDEQDVKTRYVDYGKDFYAGIVYNNYVTESGSPVMIGWANNWAYGASIPTEPWRSAMSIPRELSLRDTPDGMQLVQKPISATSTLKGEAVSVNFEGNNLWLEVEIEAGKSDDAGIRILKGGISETVIGYRSSNHSVYMDRTRSGFVSFHPDFASEESTVIEPINGKIQLEILVDESIVEVFVNGGLRTISDQVFPSEAELKTEIFGAGVSVKGWKMKSAWVKD